MRTLEKVLNIFKGFGLEQDVILPYGDEQYMTVYKFAYIIEQADPNGLAYVSVLESFDDVNDLVKFAGNLIVEINKTIENGTFAPVVGQSKEEMSIAEWAEEYPEEVIAFLSNLEG